MSKNESDPAKDRRIDGEAAEWVSRKFRGFSSSEQDEFFEWLAKDPAHSEAYVNHQDLWNRMDTLAEWMPEHSEKPHRDLLKDRHTVYRRVWLAGIAASIVLGLFLWMRPQSGPEIMPQQNYVANGYEKHVLADGSVVEMNGGAAMVVKLTPEERRVELVASEALFTVAKDIERPFIVSARGIEVKAVGTAFNVRVSDDEVEVLVTEGRVQLNANPDLFLSPDAAAESQSIVSDLAAGQSSTVFLERENSEAIVEEPGEQEIFERLAWKYRLEFDSIPLFEAVDEINRRSEVQLEIVDNDIRRLPIVATLRVDNIDYCVELLEITLGIECEYVNDGKVILKKGRSQL